jgi:RNA-directed DNA polymerase
MNTSITKSALPYITDWDSINWLNISQYVEKLQQRIYHAERLGKIRRVRDLQRLLLNSQAALLLSIRRVTQINKGKRTAGVDGYKALTP